MWVWFCLISVSEEGDVFGSVLLWSNVGNGPVTVGEETERKIGRDRRRSSPTIIRTGYCLIFRPMCANTVSLI